jgi:hypothetical protein
MFSVDDPYHDECATLLMIPLPPGWENSELFRAREEFEHSGHPEGESDS